MAVVEMSGVVLCVFVQCDSLFSTLLQVHFAALAVSSVSVQEILGAP